MSCVSRGSDSQPLFEGKISAQNFGGNAIDIAASVHSENSFSFLSFSRENEKSEVSDSADDSFESVEKKVVFEISSDGSLTSAGEATFSGG